MTDTAYPLRSPNHKLAEVRWSGHTSATVDDYTERFRGRRVGQRVIVACVGSHKAPSGTRVLHWRVKCDCGRVEVVSASGVSGIARACKRCGARDLVGKPADWQERRRELQSVLSQASMRCPEVWRGDSRESVEACVELAMAIGDEAQTLEAIACVMGLSRERVRQIEAQALRKVRLAGGPALRELWEHVEARDDWTTWDHIEAEWVDL